MSNSIHSLQSANAQSATEQSVQPPKKPQSYDASSGAKRHSDGEQNRTASTRSEYQSKCQR